MQSEFGPRIRPEEVTPETRRRLVHKTYLSELFAICSVVVPTICIALMVSLGYRWHGEPTYTEWQPISPILVTAAVILLGVLVWFARERRFLAKGQVTGAEVKEIETSYDLTHTHRLIIKYSPIPKDSVRATINGGDHGQVITVALESDLKGFNEDLHEGDNISIIYDPARPDHVRVVEEEHKIA